MYVDWFARDWLGHSLADAAYLWLLPPVPLPLPSRLRALTHRPASWRIIRFLAYMGDGLGLPPQVSDVRPSLPPFVFLTH